MEYFYIDADGNYDEIWDGGEGDLEGVAWCLNPPCENRTEEPDSLCEDCKIVFINAEGQQ